MKLEFRQWLSETLALKGDYKGSFFQRLVAAAYQISPTKSEEAIPGYRELYEKISRQNQFLQHDFEFVPDAGDHYKSMKHLKRDIEGQRASTGQRRAKMFVYAEPPGPTGEPSQQGHPVLSNDENVIIRGVHDAIAHLAGSHPFSARGEYGAYNRHLKTLCNPAQVKGGRCASAAVMFTEIVGQTSYYYIYGNFPPQKAVILHDFDHWNVGRLDPSSYLNEYFVVEGKDLIERPDADFESFYSTPIGAEFARQDQVSRFAGLRKIKSAAKQSGRAIG